MKPTMGKVTRSNKPKCAGSTVPCQSVFCSLFTLKEQEDIRATLPPGADLRAVLEVYGELLDHVRTRRVQVRELPKRRYALMEERKRWREAVELASRLIDIIREAPQSPVIPNADLPHILALHEIHQLALLRQAGSDALIEANTPPKNSFHALLYSCVLRTWTDVAGGKLGFSRPRELKGCPGGLLIDHLSLMLRLFAVPVPGLEGLAKIVKEEKQRRAHTQREAARLPKLST